MTWQQFKQQYLIRFWAPMPAVIAAGILSTYYFGLTGTFWAVTGEFTRWGGHLLAAALWANNVKLRMPQSRIRIAQALIGGIIAGFGARLAMGCNLAAFFTGIPQFSLHAWFFALATAAGSYFGARFTLLPMFRIPVKLKKVDKASSVKQDENQARRRFRIGMLVFAAIIGWGLLTMFNAPKLGIAMLCGVGFGLLIERAQICFTSAFRDMWPSGFIAMCN